MDERMNIRNLKSVFLFSEDGTAIPLSDVVYDGFTMKVLDKMDLQSDKELQSASDEEFYELMKPEEDVDE